MPNYAYKARDNSSKIVKGKMMAEDERDLSNKLSNLGYFLTQSKIQRIKRVVAKAPALPARDILNFTIQLATLIDAGVPLVGGLNDLARDTENADIRTVIEDIRHRVESGSSLKEALSFHPKTFSNLYIANIAAGESTGELSRVLNELSSFLEWQLDLRSKIKEASIYPVVLFSVMIAVVILLIVKVIPMFEPIFVEIGVALPLPTQIILAISSFVRTYWYIVAGLVILLVGGYKFFGSKQRGRYFLDHMKLKMPIFGELLRKIALSRFCRTFSLALESGVSVLSALDIAAEVIGNKYLEYLIIRVRNSVNVGEKLAVSLEVSGEFPPLVVRMISVGEYSGHLTQTLQKVNEFYGKEIPASIKRMFALFEPMMIVVMGVVVGGIALAIVLPLMQMIQTVGG
jgi:type IV pilus assembly protein PilC